jgi:hypothetical protein
MDKKKSLFAAFFVFMFPCFFCGDALAYFDDKLDSSDKKLNLSLESPSEYLNYAEKGSYENDMWVGEVPEWHYYDMFGNHLLNGFYLFGMGTGNSSTGLGQSFGQSSVSYHPFMRKWLNGVVQVGDIQENIGILVMAGDRVKTSFTPYTFNQSLFAGARFDVFSDFFYGMNTATVITSRISSTGLFGMVQDYGVIEYSADWLQGIHLTKKVKDIFDIGATYININNQEGGMKSAGFNGTKNDTTPPGSPTALTVWGFDGRCNLPKLKAYGEYGRSQEALDGSFYPPAGNVATINALWDIFDRLKFGGEGYIVGSRYKTTFSCPVHERGDIYGCGKYLYSLIEDNDDGDDFAENGKSKLNAVPVGDPDGTIPVKYDKDKHGRFDFEEDFLSYECDPPKSSLYWDRNNNGVPDDIEDDAYPDYTYVPGYYLSGEQYIRYDGKEDTAGGVMSNQVSKGLDGFHLYGQYEILPKLSLTLGGIFQKSETNSFQTIYQDTTPIGSVYASERATDLYSLIRYKKDFAGDKKLTADNYFRMVKDNIPNHTQTFSYVGRAEAVYLLGDSIAYKDVADPLDYRDAIVNQFIAQYSLYRNRGLNFTTRGKYEFTKHFAHPEFNYPTANISSLILVNKCEYIYLLPFLKDWFLIPRYKNFYESDFYGPRTDALDARFRNAIMTNAAYLMLEWKFSEKTAITIGPEFKTFNDFFNDKENYLHRNVSLQLMIKDRYSGLNMILTTGFSLYKYKFYNGGIAHNPLNNPHRIIEDISSYDIFLKIHCGF